MKTARQIRNEIERLRAKAETGEQWAEICLLEQQAIDLEKNEPVRHFQRYSPEERADRAASHRLGFRQRQSIGEAFWTHPKVPGIAFPTRKAAVKAATEECPCSNELRSESEQRNGVCRDCL